MQITVLVRLLPDASVCDLHVHSMHHPVIAWALLFLIISLVCDGKAQYFDIFIAEDALEG